MTHGAKLTSAVSSVDWPKNITTFASDAPRAERIGLINYRMALWSIELETADKGNLALSFIREAQVAGHYVACLISLALYKPAAASMRAIVDCVLHYSYFRSHPAELATLARRPDYFVDKKTIIDYHRNHTRDFIDKQHTLGVISRLDFWYSEISAIIHGQVPGKWVTHLSLKDIEFDGDVCELGILRFEETGDIVNRFLLSTVAEAFWFRFTKDGKQEFLKGLTPKQKKALGLTLA